MRVLRVGTSNDESGDVPEEKRAWAVASRMLADATGDEVETILKRGWPNESYAASVARWMAEYRPDIVVLQVNNFWYGHESVPLWLERRFGRAGKKVNSVGSKLGQTSWFAESRVGLAINRGLGRVFPSATHFTVPEVAACMETAMRRALASEGTVLIVRGNENWAELPFAGKRRNKRNLARNAAMSAAMQQLCAKLHVPYYERGLVPRGEMGIVLNGARWHNSAEGERRIGEFDGEAMTEALAAARTPA